MPFFLLSDQELALVGSYLERLHGLMQKMALIAPSRTKGQLISE